MQTGRHIIITGLTIQILFFTFFITTATHFHLSLNKYPFPRTQNRAIPWRKHMLSLYITSGLILVRSVFRLIEYAQGNDGYLLHHEAFLYVFDAVLMGVVMGVWNLVYPGEIGVFLRRDVELKEGIDGEGKGLKPV